jgi:hypothetical protein
VNVVPTLCVNWRDTFSSNDMRTECYEKLNIAVTAGSACHGTALTVRLSCLFCLCRYCQSGDYATSCFEVFGHTG